MLWPSGSFFTARLTVTSHASRSMSDQRRAACSAGRRPVSSPSLIQLSIQLGIGGEEPSWTAAAITATRCSGVSGTPSSGRRWATGQITESVDRVGPIQVHLVIRLGHGPSQDRPQLGARRLRHARLGLLAEEVLHGGIGQLVERQVTELRSDPRLGEGSVDRASALADAFQLVEPLRRCRRRWSATSPSGPAGRDAHRGPTGPAHRVAPSGRRSPAFEVERNLVRGLPSMRMVARHCWRASSHRTVPSPQLPRRARVVLLDASAVLASLMSMTSMGSSAGAGAVSAAPGPPAMGGGTAHGSGGRGHRRLPDVEQVGRIHLADVASRGEQLVVVAAR